MSLTLMKSGHYKCIYCDIIFKTEDAARAHLKTPGHKARRMSSKSSQLSMASSGSQKKTTKREMSRMEDSILSQKSSLSNRAITRTSAGPKKVKSRNRATTDHSVRSALTESINSYKSGVSIDEAAPSEYKKATEQYQHETATEEYLESEDVRNQKEAMLRSSYVDRKRNTSDAENSALSEALGCHLLDAREYDVIISKLDEIIEKENLLELRIETLEEREELAVRDRKKALQEAIDVDPVINENLEEIKRIEAAEKIIEDRLGMLSKSGMGPKPTQNMVRSTIKSETCCPMCGSGSGW